jgi:acyl carrier protein
LEERVKKIVAEEGDKDLDQVELRSRLEDLDFDSLDVLDLIGAFEEKLEIELPDKPPINGDWTVEQITAYLRPFVEGKPEPPDTCGQRI